MRKFFKESWAVIGYILGLIGTLVTILTISGSILIEMKWLVIFGTIFISAIVIAVMSTIRLNKVIQNGTRYEITAYGQDKSIDMYYTNYSKNLRVGTLVTIYYSKPFSKKLGYGVVHNSSADEYIEIKMIYVEEELDGIFEQSKTNNSKVLNDMYILPNTYIEKLSVLIEILNGGNINAKN